jgi:hypothetical protein
MTAAVLRARRLAWPRLADGRTALSQHRRRLTGRRQASRRRPVRRSVRAFLLTTAVAAVVIAGGAKYLISQYTPGPDALAAAIGGLPSSHSAALLVHERQRLILSTVSTRSFKIVSMTVASNPVPASSSGGGAPSVPYTPPNPGSAQAIAQSMLPSYGWAVSGSKGQFGCLQVMWNRESGWRYNAYNGTSGAQGIPQALPGSKMAQFGADWQTNPRTQIKWGLWYIQTRYGSPCQAWAAWQAHGGWY